jgi:hypothetical protein
MHKGVPSILQGKFLSLAKVIQSIYMFMTFISLSFIIIFCCVMLISKEIDKSHIKILKTDYDIARLLIL